MNTAIYQFIPNIIAKIFKKEREENDCRRKIGNVEAVGEETLNAKRYEWSMKESGEYAATILREIKTYIDDTLEVTK